MTGVQTCALPISTRLIPKAAVPAGSILQVVNVAGLSTVSISSGTLTNIGSVSITPTSTSSKILILASTYVHRDSTGNAGYYWSCWIYKTTATNNLLQMADAVLYQSTGDGTRETITGYYVDSPATTSSVTYGMSAARQSGSSTATFNQGNAGNIILMEIAQ